MLLTRRFAFSAAHRLASDQLDPAAQADCYGPCTRIHGHNYRLEVAVRGQSDPRTGFFANVMTLDRIVRTRIVDACDHQTLNDLPLFAGRIVTMETIAEVVWRTVQEPLAEAGMTLASVLVAETDEHWVTLTAE